MTITRESEKAVGVTFEQDVDEFFKEMAEPAIAIMPFRLSSQNDVEELLKRWTEGDWITNKAADQIRKEWSDKSFPIDGPLPIPSGHTKGYMMMRSGSLEVKDLRVQRWSRFVHKHEEATK